MTTITRAVLVLFLALAMALSAVPASADPGTGDPIPTFNIPLPDNITWE